jgi:hypothetical protein
MIKFLQKLAIVWAKNANVFVKFFVENILKIITSVPETIMLWERALPVDFRAEDSLA